jgi:ankyrin repeat protein
LLLELGFDPNYQEDNGAIHQAGVLAENREILRALLDGGASLKLRDPWYDSTGIGWADFFNYTELRDELLNEPSVCLLDALDYGRLDRVAEILASDPEALERPFAKCISREAKAKDWQTPLARMVARGKTEAVRVLLEHGANAGVGDPDGRSLLQMAREKKYGEIAELLERRSNAI